MEFYGILLDFGFDRTRFRAVRCPQTDLAVASRDAHARAVGPAVRVEEQVRYGAFAVRRYGQIGADRAAIPEAPEFRIEN